jgi:hypothetical protein
MVAYLDFRDAFASIPHSKLIARLRALRTSPGLVRFTAEWLTGRRGKCVVEGFSSPWHPLPGGVPQGSVLGPLLFILAMDPLLKTLRVCCDKLPAAFPQHRGAISAYADDLTVAMCGHDREFVRSGMKTLLRKVTEWASEYGVALSPKSKLRYFRQQAASPVPSLDPMDVGGVMLTPSVDPGRMLGVELDSTLSFTNHVDAMCETMQKASLTLAACGRYLHPTSRHAIWASVVWTALSTSALWHHRISDTNWERLERCHRAGCRAVVGAVANARNADVVAEAHFRELKVMSTLRLDTLFYLTCAKASGRHRHLQNWLLREDTNPRQDLGELIPWTLGVDPGALSLDKVRFVVPPSSGRTIHASSPDTVRRRENERVRDSIESCLPDGANVLTLWTDGSVVSRLKAGGAALLLPPDAVEEIVEWSFSKWSCSYSAEAETAVRALSHTWEYLRTRCAQGKTPISHVVLLSDSLSWISHVARGPSTAGCYSPRIWDSLRLIAELPGVESITCAFMFAHCGDPNGDRVDTAASTAAVEGEDHPVWHTDASREAKRGWLAAAMERWRSTMGLRAAPEALAPDISVIPSGLGATDATDICRLRTGLWIKLGIESISLGFNDVSTHWRCPRCDELIQSRGAQSGAVVRHLFHCPAVTRAPAHVLSSLWSRDNDVLSDVLSYCRLFTREHAPSLESTQQAAVAPS